MLSTIMAPVVHLRNFISSMISFLYEAKRWNKSKRKRKKIEEAFPGGPPCLNKLATTGFGEGSRNNALFNIAVYYKQSSPDSWEDEIVKSKYEIYGTSIK